MQNTRHLDLGCGGKPRNPYGMDHLFGCDVRDPTDFNMDGVCEYKQANIIKSGIPFPDNYFDSVSAFDLIEHIPRQLLDANGNIIYPFINIMNEIYRVLKPKGVFLAITPAYPREEAFQDPTHVNIITINTHKYFAGDKPYGEIYGFKGKFNSKRNEWSMPKNYFSNNVSPLKKKLRDLNYKIFKSGLTHIVWEFEAVKHE